MASRSLVLFCTIFLPAIVFSCTLVTGAPVFRPQVTPTFLQVTTIPTPAPTQQTVSCTAPCQCLLRSEATAVWGSDGFVQCAELPCAYTGSAVAAPQEKFCFRAKSVLSAPVSTTTTVTTVTTSLVSVQQVNCLAGTTPCPGGCTDTSSDRNNCGSCEKSCTAYQQCENGKCVAKIASVTTADPCMYQDRTSCNGACIDTVGSDSKNCGGCGWLCPAGLSCDHGECIMNCPAGFADCQYNCVDIQNDPDNCGTCGKRCTNRQTCVKGQCYDLCGVNAAQLGHFSWADWRGTNWMTVPKAQGNCGSCWAEAPTGVTEAMYNIEKGYKADINLSEQWYVSACSGNFGACTGGDNSQVLTALKSTGVPDENVLPYQSASCGMHFDPPGSLNSVCNADCNQGSGSIHCSIPTLCKPSVLAPDKLWKITSYQKETDEYAWSESDQFNTIRTAILCHGPLSVCSGHWWHCVDLIGWQGSEYSANGGWIVRNSWGANWNGNGYVVVPYGHPNSADTNDHGDLVLDAWSVKELYANV